jgi:Conserved TM helix
MEKVDVMLEPLRVFTAQVAAFLPRLLLGVLILLAGLFIAKAARFAVRRGLRALNFHVLSRRSGMDSFLQDGGTSLDTTDLFGLLAYWLALLAALIVAFNSMGLSNVTELLARVMLFVPRLFVALLMLAFGAYFARFVVGVVVAYCQGAGIRDGQALGRLARYAIMAFVIMIALEHLEIGGVIVRQTFLIVLAGVMLALALAFGLGGRAWAAAHLQRWWPAPRNDEDPR